MCVEELLYWYSNSTVVYTHDRSHYILCIYLLAKLYIGLCKNQYLNNEHADNDKCDWACKYHVSELIVPSLSCIRLECL